MRRFVADTIAGFAATDDVVLCASEVVTNAVVHGSPDDDVDDDGTLTVEVRWLVPSRVYVAVTDHGAPAIQETTEPRRVEASSTDEGFRGLALVDDLADAWGTVPLADGGHRVWFEVVAP